VQLHHVMHTTNTDKEDRRLTAPRFASADSSNGMAELPVADTFVARAASDREQAFRVTAGQPAAFGPKLSRALGLS
jgi:hypothetical protein